MDLLAQGNNIRSLIINLENKKEYIQILEEKHCVYKQTYNKEVYTLFTNNIAKNSWPFAKLENKKYLETNQLYIDQKKLKLSKIL